VSKEAHNARSKELRVQNVEVFLGNRAILKDLTFCVRAKELVFVLGKSGTGKSVLLKALTGFCDVAQGLIEVGGFTLRPQTPLDQDDLRQLRRNCGLVLQQPALLDFLNVFENVTFSVRTWPQEQRLVLAEKYLKMVQLPSDLLFKKPSSLSYGMQKRVSIARTLVMNPQVVLFDEPTTGLDPITTRQINELIASLTHNLGLTTLVVSHDVPGAMQNAGHVILLEEGKIAAKGKPEDFLSPLGKFCEILLVQQFFRDWGR
jgi:phospholipid/cholesterol/gamma-HCH transport system ATP-binding protein